MKLLAFALVISAFQAWSCNAQNATVSTIVCPDCPSTSMQPEFVTRTAAPVTPCSAPALTAVYNGVSSMATGGGAATLTMGTGTMGQTGAPAATTPAQFTGAAGRMGASGGMIVGAAVLGAVFAL